MGKGNNTAGIKYAVRLLVDRGMIRGHTAQVLLGRALELSERREIPPTQNKSKKLWITITKTTQSM